MARFTGDWVCFHITAYIFNKPSHAWQEFEKNTFYFFVRQAT
jgi:hypothetical protein